MANTTVYPYGPGGELPSGFENELRELEGTWNESFDYETATVLSNATANITIVKSGGKIIVTNITSTEGKYAMIALPDSLEVGKKYMLTIHYDASFNKNASWWLAFVNSSYSPTSGGVNLYPGTGNLATLSFTHASANVYLRLASTSQNAGATVTFNSISISDNKTTVADLSNRVIDLENGTDSFVGENYLGEKIVMNPSTKFNYERLATNGAIGQSAAIYDKYLFIVKASFTSVILYDMTARRQVYTWNTGQSVSTWHCNQSSFGTAKYDENDMFPVLYISQRPDSGSNRCIVQAYRIIPVMNGTAIASFTMTLVQTINLPAMTEQNGLGLANATIDTERNYMWTYSRYEMTGYGNATFTCFRIPALFDGNSQPISTVTLEDSDIVTSFKDHWLIYNNQGAFIHRGKLYLARAVTTGAEIHVVDLYYQRTRVSSVFFPSSFTDEPEGVFYFEDTVCFTCNGANIWKVIFN